MPIGHCGKLRRRCLRLVASILELVKANTMPVGPNTANERFTPRFDSSDSDWAGVREKTLKISVRLMLEKDNMRLRGAGLKQLSDHWSWLLKPSNFCTGDLV